MRKILIFILVVFTSFLSGCGILDLFNKDYIEIETINHISTVVLSANVKINTETYQDIMGIVIHGPSGTGSGVIFYRSIGNYFVLTNRHVVELDMEYQHRYRIEDVNGNEYQGHLYMVSELEDLAVIWFHSKENYHAVSFSETNPEVGDVVFSIGSPSGQTNTITAGKVLDYKKLESVDYEIIFHDAIIKRGSSGSMLINKNCEIVGLNTWGFPKVQDSEEDFVNGGAIPVEKILEFLAKDDFFININ